MNIKLIQIDGTIPNIALMKLAHYFRFVKGANIHFTRTIRRDLFEPKYDLILASAIFKTSIERIELLKDYYPDAIIGGSAVQKKRKETVENFLGIEPDYKFLDYSIYPEFENSIGRTQLGCHKKCGFCTVWVFEGENRATSNINEIWRGDKHPKKLLLIDNDFQTRAGWQTVCRDIIDGNFEVAFIQGINIRELTEEHGEYFQHIKFRDKNFNHKRFYCAWDHEDDKQEIERGLLILEKAGIFRSAITPYFLCNYWQKGLTEDVWTRFLFMVSRGLRPYAMIFEKWKLPKRDDLKIFQNWVNSYNCYAKPTKEGFAEYKNFYTQKIIKEKNANQFSLLTNI
jgi:hypothetical protein